jgi:hypothetical protein
MAGIHSKIALVTENHSDGELVRQTLHQTGTITTHKQHNDLTIEKCC